MFRKQCPRCYGNCLVRNDSEGVTGQKFSRLKKCETCNGTGEVAEWGWVWLMPLGLLIWFGVYWIVV